MGYCLWLWFVVLHRKIRPTHLWVELSWVVAINYCVGTGLDFMGLAQIKAILSKTPKNYFLNHGVHFALN